MAWYRTGTVSVTVNNKTITGTGTKWADAKQGIGAGQMILIPGDGSITAYEIASVDSDTKITLVNNYTGATGSGKGYAIVNTYVDSVPDFARRLAAQIAYYQTQMDGLSNLYTGTGDVTLTTPDGQTVTLPSYTKMTTDVATKTTGGTQTFKGSVETQGVLKAGAHWGAGNLPTSQGSYLAWNRETGSGRMSLVCHRGAGGGGMELLNVGNDGSSDRLLVVSSDGDTYSLNNIGVDTYGKTVTLMKKDGTTRVGVMRFDSSNPNGKDNVFTLGAYGYEMSMSAKTDITMRINGADYTALSTRNGYTKSEMETLSAMPVGATSGDRWFKVGSIKDFQQNGRTLAIHVYGNNGYNGGANHNGYFMIMLRTGNGSVSTINAVGRAAITAYNIAGNMIRDIGVVESASQVYDIYVKVAGFSGGNPYVIASDSINRIALNWTWDTSGAIADSAVPTFVLNRAVQTFYSTLNTSVDGNGFIKAASPIARLTNDPSKMADNFLSGEFTLSGNVAVNEEAVGVNAERVDVGVYKLTGMKGLAEEGWTIEIPQDVNGNRLCFVSTEMKDGALYVNVNKRKFDLDTAMIIAGAPIDIPDGRWVDLRLQMPEPAPVSYPSLPADVEEKDVTPTPTKEEVADANQPVKDENDKATQLTSGGDESQETDV